MDYIPYILLGIIFLFLGMQIAFRLGSQRMVGKPAPDVSGLLDGPYDPGRKALFYFYGAHCPPCRTLAPRIDRLAERYPNVFKVDVSEGPELATRFGITATPTIILVEAGTIAKAMVGTLSEKRLTALMEANTTASTSPG